LSLVRYDGVYRPRIVDFAIIVDVVGENTLKPSLSVEQIGSDGLHFVVGQSIETTAIYFDEAQPLFCDYRTTLCFSSCCILHKRFRSISSEK
jgi:hypothetical protein